MNKKGASKGKVLVIALDDKPEEILTDKEGFVLCFDTFKQIGDYCFENNINLDFVLVSELNKDTGRTDIWSDFIDEVEF